MCTTDRAAPRLCNKECAPHRAARWALNTRTATATLGPPHRTGGTITQRHSMTLDDLRTAWRAAAAPDDMAATSAILEQMQTAQAQLDQVCQQITLAEEPPLMFTAPVDI